MKPTADLYDDHGDDLQSCTTQFRPFGARTSFEGAVTTVKCHEDNVILKTTVGEPGAGRVLVVDGGGSLAAALMGDVIADLAASNGWEGVIIHGAVRDVEALSKVNLGIKALGSNPRKSRKDGIGEKDVEVSFGEVTFTPGCHLYSDADGILVTRG
ncbi:ribonuclease E activity regulator RraA [Streptomyces sp. NPDC052236]|uniref:ribonuclease E activity regulator RraA n=1 Tax=Streptomyces sp. NPDC052236 TaxID=3365686 RepID=UPI0037D36662